MNYHREKLGFQDEKAFRVLEAQHQKEYPSLIEKNKQQRRALNQERDVLQNAQNALLRDVLYAKWRKYPDHPEMAYMGFKTARLIHKLNEQSNRIVSVDEIEKMKMARDRDLDKINDSLHQAKSNINRVHSAEDYVKGYEKADEIVHKYENNPFLIKYTIRL